MAQNKKSFNPLADDETITVYTTAEIDEKLAAIENKLEDTNTNIKNNHYTKAQADEKFALKE